jgi:hypothetical protein
MLKVMVDMELLVAEVFLGLTLDLLELEAMAAVPAGTSMLAPDISPISLAFWGMTSPLKGLCIESFWPFLDDDPSSCNVFMSNPIDSSLAR